MPSWVNIANDALASLGGMEIQSLDENREPARAIKRVYELVRDQVLAEHPWNCAIKRASLPAAVAPPAWGFSYQYTLPANPYCLRVLGLDPQTHGADVVFKVEGRKILTDEAAPLKILYLARLTDPEEFSPWVARVISARIAARIAYRLTNSATTAERMREWAVEELKAARSIDAQEGVPDPVVTDTFLAARA